MDPLLREELLRVPLLFLDEELLLPDRALLPRLEDREDPRTELFDREEEPLPEYFLLPELLRLLDAFVPLRFEPEDRRDETLLRLFVPDRREETLLLLPVEDRREETLLRLFFLDAEEETLLLLLVVADFVFVRETLLFLAADVFVRVVEDPRYVEPDVLLDGRRLLVREIVLSR